MDAPDAENEISIEKETRGVGLQVSSVSIQICVALSPGELQHDLAWLHGKRKCLECEVAAVQLSLLDLTGCVHSIAGNALQATAGNHSNWSLLMDGADEPVRERRLTFDGHKAGILVDAAEEAGISLERQNLHPGESSRFECERYAAAFRQQLR